MAFRATAALMIFKLLITKWRLTSICSALSLKAPSPTWRTAPQVHAGSFNFVLTYARHEFYTRSATVSLFTRHVLPLGGSAWLARKENYRS
jgi:hypothetical protein